MRLGLCLLLGTFASLVSGGAVPAPKWSPDGHFVAWVSVLDGLDTVPGPGWLFESRAEGLSRVALEPKPARLSRIEVVNAETQETWKVEDSSAPLTAPEWSPTGKALVFGRLDRVAMSFELMIVEGNEPARVLTRRPIARSSVEFSPGEFASLGISWSGDGRAIAFTMPADPPELVIVRADDGRVLKTVSGGSSPAWSPDGLRLAFLRGADSRSIWVMDSGMGGLKRLAEFVRVFQSPGWSRDGKAIQAVVQQSADAEKDGLGSLCLARLPLDSGSPETVTSFPMDVRLLPTYPSRRAASDSGISVATDREGEDLFTCVGLPSRPTVVVWTHPRTGETVDRMHPLDFSVRVDGMSLSPRARSMALHMGGEAGVAALWSYVDRRLTPLVSDDLSRREWVSLLVETCRQLSRSALPAAAVNGKRVERPTLLPVRGELLPDHEISIRLRQVANLGRSLCDRPSQPPAASPRFEEYLEEARLYFDYLREDYPAALRGINHLDSRLTSPDDRLRLLALRAQVEIALNDLDQAKDIVAYLISVDERAVSRIETTPMGVTLTPETNSRDGWPRYLAHRLEDLARARKSNGSAPEFPSRAGSTQGRFLFPMGRDLEPFEPGVRGVVVPDVPPHVVPPDLRIRAPKPPRPNQPLP